ncbi:hypothetical protein [Clostridium thermobutyricum]|uniref:Phage integrase family protein n=1 Tax=Clostridium thermobutyricum DSM 4928 TaxID=1121339 RepID=A0A1V4SSQ0_9CLOT|nr:hypothetical protein [Clostridium thermobutyricum]OPX46475.1 hypothetical protein CLTHE_28620 [Clostridium thermobutyricum DSM 4928]
MARNRVKLGSLTRQIQERFDSKLAIGESKYKAKKDGTANEKIYSWQTYKSYMKQANEFTRYCKEKHQCRTLDECRTYVDEWLKNGIDRGLSAYTQKLNACSLAKLYSCSSSDFGVRTSVRHRVNITRSRGDKVRDKHFSEEKNKDLVEFCKSTGLRREELKCLTGDKLIHEDGVYKIIVDRGSKGGRMRKAPVIGNVNLVVNLMSKAGDNKVFEKVKSGADIHSYRSEYATSLYKSIARKIEDIPYDKVNRGTGRKYQSEVYSCRSDLKGVKYDKRAMLDVSKALGHNRISVIAEHYLKV